MADETQLPPLNVHKDATPYEWNHAHATRVEIEELVAGEDWLLNFVERMALEKLIRERQLCNALTENAALRNRIAELEGRDGK